MTVLYAYGLRRCGRVLASVPVVAPCVLVRAHRRDIPCYDACYASEAAPPNLRGQAALRHGE